jgi:hypothetical protein
MVEQNGANDSNKVRGQSVNAASAAHAELRVARNMGATEIVKPSACIGHSDESASTQK